MIENRPEKWSKKSYRVVLPQDFAEETRPRRTPAAIQWPAAEALDAVPLARPAPPARRIELNDSRCYLNRELSWLEFNRRLLGEASDERTPLLERLNFQAIVSSNLDRFFMERITSFKKEAISLQQLMECRLSILDLNERWSALLVALRKQLEQKGIVIESYPRLCRKEKQQLRKSFYADIYPLLTPQAVGPAHPFPFIANLSLNVLATLRHPECGELTLARVKVPVGEGVSRFLRIGDRDRFVPLEEVVIHNLDLLFPGMQLVDCELFRVTRQAAAQVDGGEAGNLLAMMQAELKERAFAPVSRLEVGAGMTPEHRGLLAKELRVDAEGDVIEVSGLLAGSDLCELARLDRPELHYPPHEPVEHPFFRYSRNIFEVIREQGQLLLQHPYISFASSVGRFLREAAHDPGVRAIKMTLYRTALPGDMVDSLLLAAQNGKHVSVVVELKARFQEAANVRLAELLEETGIHVSYGVVGLETHAKVLLVVREEADRLRRYVHIGTGDYHPETALSYSDLGLFTCDETIAQDISELFNYLTTGFTPWRRYRAVMPAPKLLKKALMTRIRREEELAAEGRGGLIRFKVNALDDGDVVKALYSASQSGVQIELYARDCCRLRPGVPGLSENVRVVSTVGRFLEHARIYHFGNGGHDEYFISSADPVKGDLESRVEILCPVSAPAVVEELAAIFDLHRADRRSSWDMQPDGSYLQRRPAPGEAEEGLQQMMTARIESTFSDFVDTVGRRRFWGCAGV